MLYITGDTHGNQLKWLEQIHPALSPGDGVIVAGDFGYGFWSGPLGRRTRFTTGLAAQPYAVFFIDGNHENFDRLLALPVEPWRGGRIQRIRPNVIHLMARRGLFNRGAHGLHLRRRTLRRLLAAKARRVVVAAGDAGAGGVPPRVGEPAPRPWPVDYSSRTPPRLRRGTISPRCTGQYPPAAAGGAAAHELSRGRAPCDGLSPLVLWPPPHRSGALVARAGRGI